MLLELHHKTYESVGQGAVYAIPDTDYQQLEMAGTRWTQFSRMIYYHWDSLRSCRFYALQLLNDFREHFPRSLYALCSKKTSIIMPTTDIVMHD